MDLTVSVTPEQIAAWLQTAPLHQSRRFVSELLSSLHCDAYAEAAHFVAENPLDHVVSCPRCTRRGYVFVRRHGQPNRCDHCNTVLPGIMDGAEMMVAKEVAQ